MKRMRKLITAIALSAIFILGINVFMRQSFVVAAANETESCWMLDTNTDTAFKSTLTAGTTSGYDSYKIGSPATLTATANEGFKVVAWMVNCGGDFGTFYLTPEFSSRTLSVTIDADPEIYTTETTISATFSSENESVLHITKRFADCEIEPVFDYKYYFVELKDIDLYGLSENYVVVDEGTEIDLMNLDSDDAVLYYEIDSTRPNVFVNSILHKQNKFYYYGDVLSDGTNYFTIHKTPKAEGGEVSLKVDLNSGAFRLGTNVQFDCCVDSSVNVDVVGVSKDGTSLDLTTSTLAIGTYKIEQDSNLRTTKVQTLFEVTNGQNVIEILKENLYKILLAYNVDGTAADSVAVTKLLSITTLSNWYSKIDDTSYYVKNSSDNNGFTFSISLASVFTANSYTFFEFDSLDGVKTTSVSYAVLNADKDVQINYKASKYAVTFRFAEWDGHNISLTARNFGTARVDEFVAGETREYTSSDAPKMTGFEFKGFALSQYANGLERTISYTVPADAPRSATVFVCYQKVNYTVSLTWDKTISLNGTTPLRTADLYVNGTYSDNISTFSDEDVSFTSTVMIDDDISFNLGTNAGFNIKSLMFNGSELADSSIGIDESFLENVSDDEIKIFVNVDYNYYTLEYSIAPIRINGTTIIMAEIGVLDGDGAQLDSNRISVEKVGNEISKIIVTGIKHYENIQLTSVGKRVNDVGSDSYLFGRFVENGIKIGGDDSDLSLTILQNRNISVEYSTPTGEFIVKFDGGYFDAAGLQNLQDGVAVRKESATENLNPIENADGSLGYKFTQDEKFRISFNKDNINFGYSLTSLTIEGSSTDVNSWLVDDFIDNEELTMSDSQTKILTLVFSPITYAYNINTSYNGESKGSHTGALTVDSPTITFEKLEGYYIKSVMAQGTLIAYLTESNDKRNDIDRTIYSHSFTFDQIKNLIVLYTPDANGVVNLTLEFEYEIYSYEVWIHYVLTNRKGADEINYPNLFMKIEGGANSIVPDYNKGVDVALFNVPYNSNISFTTDGIVPSGLKVEGWFNMSDNLLSRDQEFSLANIKEDAEYQYALSYVIYSLAISHDGNHGSPSMAINGAGTPAFTNQFKIYDVITLLSNPTYGNGYTFEKFVYFVPKAYIYDSNRWEEDKIAGIYIYKEGYYEKVNQDAEYKDGTSYFVSQAEVYNESSNFTKPILANSFLFEKHDEKITANIEVCYKKLEMTLNTISKMGNYWTAKDFGFENPKQLEEFLNSEIIPNVAIYTIFKINKDGSEVEISLTDVLTVDDQIKIVIKINDSLQTSNKGKFNMQNGLTMSETVEIGGVEEYAEDNGDGTYTFKIEIKSIVRNWDVVEDVQNQIKTEFTFAVKDITLTTTTNFSSKDFYFPAGGSVANMKIESQVGVRSVSVTQTKLMPSCSGTFLKVGNATYELNNKNDYYYEKNFVVKNVNVYNSKNELITEVEKQIDKNGNLISVYYPEYGVTVNYVGEVVFNSVSVRLMQDVTIEFVVEPVMTYNGAEYDEENNCYIFTKSFDCFASGEGVEQKLTMGSDKEIGYADNVIKLSVKYKDANGISMDSVKNCGDYDVVIKFDTVGGYKIPENYKLPYAVKLQITKLEVKVWYDTAGDEKHSKPYDGNANYYSNQVMKYVTLTFESKTAGKQVVVYTQNEVFALESVENVVVKITSTSDKKQIDSSQANEDGYYNIHITNINLIENNPINKNFYLDTIEVIIPSFIRINKQELKLDGLIVYDKVYDETNIARIDNSDEALSKVKLLGVVAGEVLEINLKEITATFEDAEIGESKDVFVDASNAIQGGTIANYKINQIKFEGKKIYRYTLSVDVEGYGTISIFNDRGRNGELGMINNSVIPFDSELKVEVVKNESVEYNKLFSRFSQFTTRRNVFAVGYRIYLDLYGEQINLNKYLRLSIPDVEELTNVIGISSSDSKAVQHEVENGYISVELSQFGNDMQYIVLIHNRSLLKLWQIILISVSAAVIVAGGVLTFVLIRRRKLRRYSEHDKI